MSTLRDSLKALVGPEIEEPAPPLEPPNINGQESALVWSDNLGGGDASSGGAAPAALDELTEVVGTRTYYAPAYITDPRSLQTAKVKPLKSCRAVDADGTEFTINFANPYT